MAESQSVHDFDQNYLSRRTLRRTMIWHHSLHAEVVARLWDNPLALIQSGEPLQDKERCLVAKLIGTDGSLVLKRHNWGGIWKTFCKCLRTPQARQSFVDGLYLVQHGVRTPRPMALVEHKLGVFGAHSYLLSEYVQGTSLYRLMRFENPSSDLVVHLADQVLELCTQFDDLRFTHNDLKPENLMVDPAGRVWLIDLEKARCHERPESVRERLLEDLNRFLHARNWRENREAGELFRKRLAEHPAVLASLAQVRPKKHPICEAQPFDRGNEHKLSVLVVSPKSAANLRSCIDSFRDIADEIVVADSEATEETRQLLTRLRCRLVERIDQAENATDFRNRALTETRHPWILVVEGDERVSPDLSKEIQCLLTAGPQVEAYRIPCRRTYLGHVSKYGVFRSEAPMRLFRRGLGRFVAHRTRIRIRTRVTQPGRTKSKLTHFTSWHVTDLVGSMNDETTRLAKVRFQSGKRPRLFGAIYRVGRRFLKNYLIRQAFLDGAVGLQMSILSAMGVMMTEIKLWELCYARLQHDPSTVKPPLDVPMFQASEEAAPGRIAA
jgi:hypothetical protein